MNIRTWKKGDPMYKVWESPDWLYKCPSCNSKNMKWPVEWEELVGGSAAREVNCKRCGTSMPWLQHRDYGITPRARMMRQKRDRLHPPWEEKTPLWAIPTNEETP